jgi:16S rRNA (uracil1498-N3)-methyltransferase
MINMAFVRSVTDPRTLERFRGSVTPSRCYDVAVSTKLRVPHSPLCAGELTLLAEESHYVSRVRRMSAGDELVLFDSDAKTEADAVILIADKKRTRVNVGALRAASVVGSLPVTLIQALGKGDKPERVLRDATALGIARVVIVETERSVPRGPKRRARWQKVLSDAARQSGRGDVPELSLPEDLDAALNEAAGSRFVLAPSAETSLMTALRDWRGRQPLTLLIGPEGGLSEDEISRALTRGFLRVRFGSLVLRTETACTALLGALLALSEGR